MVSAENMAALVAWIQASGYLILEYMDHGTKKEQLSKRGGHSLTSCDRVKVNDTQCQREFIDSTTSSWDLYEWCCMHLCIREECANWLTFGHGLWVLFVYWLSIRCLRVGQRIKMRWQQTIIVSITRINLYILGCCSWTRRHTLAHVRHFDWLDWHSS